MYPYIKFSDTKKPEENYRDITFVNRMLLQKFEFVTSTSLQVLYNLYIESKNDFLIFVSKLEGQYTDIVVISIDYNDYADKGLLPHRYHLFPDTKIPTDKEKEELLKTLDSEGLSHDTIEDILRDHTYIYFMFVNEIKHSMFNIDLDNADHLMAIYDEINDDKRYDGFNGMVLETIDSHLILLRNILL